MTHMKHHHFFMHELEIHGAQPNNRTHEKGRTNHPEF